jgi:hypothetical protein
MPRSWFTHKPQPGASSAGNSFDLQEEGDAASLVTDDNKPPHRIRRCFEEDIALSWQALDRAACVLHRLLVVETSKMTVKAFASFRIR